MLVQRVWSTAASRKIVIPTDKDTLQTVVEQGLLPVDDENVTQLSLKATTDNLEESGWTIEAAE